MHRPRIIHNRKRLMAYFLVMNLVLSPLSSYAVEEGRIETGVESLTENPTPENGENVPPTPSIPERIRVIEKRIGEILGEARKRPLTPEEQKELKRLGEVLGALRREQSRKVNTADTSRMLWYALASSLSIMLLAAYSFLEKAKKKR